jgi:hypothetical protein
MRHVTPAKHATAQRNKKRTRLVGGSTDNMLDKKIQKYLI